MSDRMQIAREFSDGFVAALLPSPIDETKSEHWQAGYIAGYPLRKQKNDKLNEHMVATGRKPFGVVRLA